MRLGPGRARSLLIHYTANSFVSPERVRFQYQLLSHDQSWQEDRNNLRTAIYTDWHPGNYQFRVRAFNNRGVASEKDAELAFSLAPHFYQTWMFYVLCSTIVLAAGGSLHALRMAGIKRIKALEQHHALEMERARIAKDLHDSLGADLTKIALVARTAKARNGSSDQRLNWERVASLAGGLVDGLGELIWATNPRQNTLESLAAYLREYAVELCESADLAARMEFPADVPDIPISGEMRRNLFLAVKEALANVTKHAHASRVVLAFDLSQTGALVIRVEDDGKGFDLDGVGVQIGTRHGNGLRHLRERLAATGGRLQIDSKPGGGTTVQMSVPVAMSRRNGNPTARPSEPGRTGL